MSRPLFSVIVPTFNGMESIAIAIQSIVEQSYDNIELVVSDDNGIGTSAQIETEQIVNRFKDKLNIKYLANEHVNGSHARNKGLEIAQGEYIALLDDDDFYLKDRLLRASEEFEKNPNCEILFCDVTIITRENVNRTVTNNSLTAKEFLFGKKEIGTGSNVCFRKSLYERTGGFDETFLRYQDVEFIAKRINDTNVIWDRSVQIAKYYNINENYLNYKRALSMQKHLRDEMLKHNVLNEEETSELEFIQIHTMYNDMLVKNMEISDIKVIYNMMKKKNKLSILDRILFIVYSLSKGMFNYIYKTLSNRTNDKDNSKSNFLLEYRNRLENNSK